jgi:hypothetical protein
VDCGSWSRGAAASVLVTLGAGGMTGALGAGIRSQPTSGTMSIAAQSSAAVSHAFLLGIDSMRRF